MKELLSSAPLNLNGLGKKIHEVNTANGWYDDGVPPIPEQIALIHSEASEMLEAYRNGKYVATINTVGNTLDVEDDAVFQAAFKTSLKDTMEQELADVVIRCLDFAAARGININDHVLAGLRYNSLRGYRHGGKVC